MKFLQNHSHISLCCTIYLFSLFIVFILVSTSWSPTLRASLVAQTVKNPPAMQETWVPSLGWEGPLEKGMATHSSIWPGEFQGQRSLADYSPWGCKEWEGTGWTPLSDFHFSPTPSCPSPFPSPTGHRPLVCSL